MEKVALQAKQFGQSQLDLDRAPFCYVLYGVKYIDPVSPGVCSGQSQLDLEAGRKRMSMLAAKDESSNLRDQIERRISQLNEAAVTISNLQAELAEHKGDLHQGRQSLADSVSSNEKLTAAIRDAGVTIAR